MNSQEAKPQAAIREQSLRKQLLAWYDEHARDLPWRESHDPYRVWLSEIMLQQTRVAAVIAHYHEFLRRFPTVEKLAHAREASVLAAWSGLGYYRRARMLHAAAKVVARERGGKFPKTAEGLRELPGIGRYTAAAIASIAFGEPIAVVDGNVERVLQRFSGRRLAGEEFWVEAEALLDRARPGDFNQALMELGATVCTPRSPACLTCPVVEFCATRGEMARATKASPQKKREIHYALDYRSADPGEGKVFLVQRPRDARLMARMWELPELANPPRSHSLSFRRLAKRARGTRFFPAPTSGVQGQSPRPSPYLTLKHSITITDYAVQVWRVPALPHATGKWIPVKSLSRIALTGLARKILRKAEIIAPTGRSKLLRMKRFLVVAVCAVGALYGELPAIAQDAPAQTVSAGTQQTGVVLTKLSPPVYPPLARQANIFGEVRVDLSIRQDGTVAAAEVFSGHPMLTQAALESAQQSHFECRGCGDGLTNFSLTYAFEMKDDGACCSAWSRTPEVSRSPDRISIVAPHGCLCDPTATITRLKWRSAKCLYLWHCASRVVDAAQ